MKRPRRWEVSDEELEQIAAARRGPLSARASLLLLLRTPSMIPDTARVVAEGIRDAVFGNNALICLLDAAVCTDRSGAMVAEARQNLSSFTNVRVARTSGVALTEFTDSTFALVFGQGVLGYLDPNPLLALLGEVRRVLRSDGVCVFNFFTIDHESDAGSHLATVTRQARTGRFHGGTDRAYAAAQIESLYRAAGLELVADHGSAAGEPTSGRSVLIGRAQNDGRR